MAQGRMWMGVGLLLVFAGTAAAQPAFPNTTGPDRPVGVGLVPSSFQPSSSPPAFLPPGVQPPGYATVTQPVGEIQTLSGLVDDHPPMKELPSGLGDLIPPPAHGGHGHGHGCGHGEHGCGGHHEISGFMTPFIPEHGGWYVSGEFLLQRPRNSDLDFVIPNINPGLGTIGPIQSLRYDLGTGLRAEVGRRWGEGKWETGFAYTYLTSSGEEGNFVAGPGQILLPTFTRPGLTDRVLTATGTLDLDYQLFDMIVARRVLVDEHFGVRWIGGFRFTDIRQTMAAFYDGADARGAAIASRSRFQGFGPMAGAEAVLVGWKGFHAYSRVLGGLIYGRNSERLFETNDSGATTYINTSYDVRKVVPMGSLAMGVGWQYRTIAIRAGYEVTHWQGIYERPRFVDDVGQGKVITKSANITLEGLFIQAALSY
jgi:hypothetical protein